MNRSQVIESGSLGSALLQNSDFDSQPEASGSFQLRLNRCVSDTMRVSGKKLDHLAHETGICKTQLSKMQNGRRHVSYEHAHAIFRACGLHPRAMMLLCGLSAEELASPATTGFVDGLLEGLPSLVRLLFDDVQVVDPSWGSSSVSALEPLLKRCIERAKARNVDIFAMTMATYRDGPA
jgi:DNA-binding transcriptional regulator YdaS (Cro superfamily)